MISSEDVRRVTFEKAFRAIAATMWTIISSRWPRAWMSWPPRTMISRKGWLCWPSASTSTVPRRIRCAATMINAQRLGENVIREAKQKAAEIIRTANIKAEDREQRARDDVELAKQEIVTLKSEADSFKRSLIEMYRKHINLINKLPEYTPQPEDAPARPVQPAAEPVQAPTQTAAPVEQPVMAAEPAYTPPAPQPAAESAPAPVQERLLWVQTVWQCTMEGPT